MTTSSFSSSILYLTPFPSQVAQSPSTPPSTPLPPIINLNPANQVVPPHYLSNPPLPDAAIAPPFRIRSPLLLQGTAVHPITILIPSRQVLRYLTITPLTLPISSLTPPIAPLTP